MQRFLGTQIEKSERIYPSSGLVDSIHAWQKRRVRNSICMHGKRGGCGTQGRKVWNTEPNTEPYTEPYKDKGRHNGVQMQHGKGIRMCRRGGVEHKLNGGVIQGGNGDGVQCKNTTKGAYECRAQNKSRKRKGAQGLRKLVTLDEAPKRKTKSSYEMKRGAPTQAGC